MSFWPGIPLFVSRAIIGCIFLSPAAIAQTPVATIIYTEESPDGEPEKFTLNMDESGTGHYLSTVRKARSNLSSDLAPTALNLNIMVSKGTRDKLFTTARRRKFFSSPCDANDNKRTGGSTKTLVYSGMDGQGRCTFIWSRDHEVRDLSDILEGIEVTVEEGARLGLIYRYQPLSCDEELRAFASLVQEKQALEVENIAPLLHKIATDGRMLEKCQETAQRILTLAKVE